MAFAVILQHEVRNPLAEAVCSIWAFFLTLRDHEERPPKLRKCHELMNRRREGQEEEDNQDLAGP